MAKTFEDDFSYIQTDMIQICLEYVEDKADKIYIYASFEENAISCDYFYEIEGQVLERHELNLAGKKYDTSIQRQKACMNILNDDMKKLMLLCKEYSREVPTEIKLVYDIKKNSVNADYQYEPVYSQYSDKTADDISYAWFEQEKARVQTN